MPVPTQRQLRVGNLLQREIADILRREMEDPDIGFVTVTGVDVTADLRHARVFVSVLGDEVAKRDTMRALIRGRKFMRGLLGRRLDLRRIPELQFRLDETAERAQRMAGLLQELADESGDGDEPAP